MSLAILRHPNTSIMKIYLPICFSMLAIVTSCSRRTRIEITQAKPFTYSAMISPTPINKALQRYTDFQFHYRVADGREFTAISPSRVVPSQDGSVNAEFLVTMAEPKTNQVYDSFYSYKIDGKEAVSDTKHRPIIYTRHL